MSTGRSMLNEQTPRILPGLPRKTLTPEQQLEALRKVQAQAEQRVKLGMQLFKSAEARLAAHADLVSQVRNEQKYLRDKVSQDIDQRLRVFDRKMEQIDDRLDEVVKALEGKIDAIAMEWRQSQAQLDQTRQRCEALLEQSQRLLEAGVEQVHAQPITAPSPPPVSAAAPAAVSRRRIEPTPVTPLEQLEEAEFEVEPSAVDEELDATAPPPIPMPTARVTPTPAEPDAASDAPKPERLPVSDEERIYSQILRRLRQQDHDAA